MTDHAADPRFDVFLSYNRKDQAAVMRLAQRLQSRGIKPWLDVWELKPGLPWQEAMETVIETTKVAVVLVGEDGVGPWQNREMRAWLNEFVERNVPVIPVMLPGRSVKPNDLPTFLKQFTWVDLRGDKEDDGFERLVWGITGESPYAEKYNHVNITDSSHPAKLIRRSYFGCSIVVAVLFVASFSVLKLYDFIMIPPIINNAVSENPFSATENCPFQMTVKNLPVQVATSNVSVRININLMTSLNDSYLVPITYKEDTKEYNIAQGMQIHQLDREEISVDANLYTGVDIENNGTEITIYFISMTSANYMKLNVQTITSQWIDEQKLMTALNGIKYCVGTQVKFIRDKTIPH